MKLLKNNKMLTFALALLMIVLPLSQTFAQDSGGTSEYNEFGEKVMQEIEDANIEESWDREAYFDSNGKADLTEWIISKNFRKLRPYFLRQDSSVGEKGTLAYKDGNTWIGVKDQTLVPDGVEEFTFLTFNNCDYQQCLLTIEHNGNISNDGKNKLSRHPGLNVINYTTVLLEEIDSKDSNLAAHGGSPSNIRPKIDVSFSEDYYGSSDSEKKDPHGKDNNPDYDFGRGDYNNSPRYDLGEIIYYDIKIDGIYSEGKRDPFIWNVETPGYNENLKNKIDPKLLVNFRNKITEDTGDKLLKEGELHVCNSEDLTYHFNLKDKNTGEEYNKYIDSYTQTNEKTGQLDECYVYELPDKILNGDKETILTYSAEINPKHILEVPATNDITLEYKFSENLKKNYLFLDRILKENPYTGKTIPAGNSLHMVHFTQKDFKRISHLECGELIDIQNSNLKLQKKTGQSDIHSRITKYNLDNPVKPSKESSLLSYIKEIVGSLSKEPDLSNTYNIREAPLEFHNGEQVLPGRPSCTVNFKVYKRLEGRELKANEFTFDLIDEQGKVVATATNDENGLIKFLNISVSSGVQVYKVVEHQTDNNVIYDDEKNIKVISTIPQTGGTSICNFFVEYMNNGEKVDKLEIINKVRPDDYPLPMTGRYDSIILISASLSLATIAILLITKNKKKKNIIKK